MPLKLNIGDLSISDEYKKDKCITSRPHRKKTFLEMLNEEEYKKNLQKEQ